MSRTASIGSNVLAIHLGDLHLRAAFLDTVNAPTRIEDKTEMQNFVTPSLATVDTGGILLGYPALMAISGQRSTPVRWRYRRASLASREVLVQDELGRGLTSAAFAALTARRLGAESCAWSSLPPDLVLVVPDTLTPDERLRLATLANETAEHPVGILGENQALLYGLGLNQTDGPVLVVSIDDDAARLRLLDRDDSPLALAGEQSLPALGLQSLRTAWLERWNHEAGELQPGSKAFDDGESFEFEKIWQDIWQCLETDPRFKPPMPTWPLLRQSSLLPLSISRTAIKADVEAFWNNLARIAERFLAESANAGGTLAAVVLVAPTAVSRTVLPALAERLAVPRERCRTATADAYANGAARMYAAGHDGRPSERTSAAHGLCVLGMAKDVASPSVKHLIDAGSPLPASASFSVAVNRDVQKRLSISLAREQDTGNPEVSHQFEFGPLLGQGMQRIKFTVGWTPDGLVTATATDAETELPLPCADAREVAAGTPLLGAEHIRQLDMTNAKV